MLSRIAVNFTKGTKQRRDYAKKSNRINDCVAETYMRDIKKLRDKINDNENMRQQRFRKKRPIFGTCGISFIQIMHLQTDSICTYTNAICEEHIFFDL